MIVRRLPLAIAAVAALGLLTAAPAGAYSAGEKRAERKQNTRIKTALKGLSAQQVVNQAQDKSLTDLKTLAEGIDGRVKAIEAGVPLVFDGLKKLEQAALDLKAGLETAGAGLTSLKTLAGATEYGVGQVVVLEPAPNPQEGSFVVTPDIPDAVQQAQTTQQFIAQNTGNLLVAVAVRSGESDGTGASNPAAHCKVTLTNETGATQTSDANGSLGGLPFQPSNTKSALTSTDPANAGFPFGLKTSGADADQTTNHPSAPTVGVTAGDTYTVGLSCVDLSPSSTDPSA
jgi:hypothetical protein